MNDWIRIAGNRFTLNGRPVRIKGTNFQTRETPWRVLQAYDPASIEAGLDDAAALGCNCARLYVSIADRAEHERFADFLDLAQQRGIRLYPCFAWHGTFGMPPIEMMRARTGFDALSRFARACRDDPRIFAYDIINEPDWFSDELWHWAMHPEAAGICIDWLAAAVVAIRSADSRHPVSVGLIFNDSWWSPAPARRLIDTMDFVDFHYYHRTYKNRSLAEAIREVKARTGKPILVGEFGNSSDPTYSTDGEPRHGEEIQGVVYRDYARDLVDEPVAGCLQWTLYEYTDQPRDHGENSYGILRGDRSWKPAAHAYRDLIPSDPL